MNYNLVRPSKVAIIVIFSLLFAILCTSHVMAATVLEDGEYTIDYEILRGDTKDNSTSLANGYWDKPAKVIVKNGTIAVQTTINQNTWVIDFSTKYNGSFVDAKVVSKNEKANTRVTEFKVNDLEDILDAKMSVFIPKAEAGLSSDYDHSYSVRILFKSDTLKQTSVAATPTPTPTATPTPTVTPSATPVPTKKPVATDTGKATDTTSNKATVSPSPNTSTDQPASSTTPNVDKNDGNSTTSSSGTGIENNAAVATTEPDLNTSTENNVETPVKETIVDPVVDPIEPSIETEDIVEANESGVTANDALDSDSTPDIQVIVDKEEQKGDKTAMYIIIIVAILIIAGVITWLVMNKRKKK